MLIKFLDFDNDDSVENQKFMSYFVKILGPPPNYILLNKERKHTI